MDAVAELRIAATTCEVVVAASPPARSFPHSLAAAAFIVLWTVLNLLYLAFLCPHDLAPDEAHYWHWSRHLDWSYYSKGPLVAWLIRASCEPFGDTMFAVRLPAVLSSAALLAGLYVLIADVLHDRRLALGTILCAIALPGVSAGAVLMTIDPPFLACWCWSLVGLNRAIERNSLGWWCIAGFCTALGVLAKYPMLLLPAAMWIWLARKRAGSVSDGRAESVASASGSLRVGLLVYSAITLLGCVPILIWSANHDWVSLQHVLGQAGVNPDTEATWTTPLAYIGGQVGLLFGFWFVAVAAGAWRFRRTRDTGLSLAWWSSVPVWCVFLAASFRTPSQLNWPAAAYVGGSVLAAAWLRDAWTSRGVRIGLILAVILGSAYSFGLRFPQLFRPMIAAVLPQPSDGNPTPIRKLDPTTRLAGWRTLAAEIDRQRERIREETGEDPVLAGMTWTLPGELAFRCAGQPEVFSFGLALADRHSQYDLWRPNPVSDPEAFRGRTFLYVGDRIPEFDSIFERVEEPIIVTQRERDVPLARWTIWRCRGFRGFPERRTPIGY